MKIKLNLDKQTFAKKPEPFPPVLRTRLCSANAITEITPGDLISAIENGQTFTPAVMTGTTGDTWQSQQIICVDIDNKKKDGTMLEPPLTPQNALRYMAVYGITPYFMYYTFSNTPEWPRYRIVLILSEPLTEATIANNITARFAGIFNTVAPGSADTSTSDAARIFFGGKRGSVFETPGKITELAALQALPHFEADPQRSTANTKQRSGDFERDKENFDLLNYVLQTERGSTTNKIGHTIFVNPCPLCGHNNDFAIDDNKPHLYKDFGANGGTGGSIIDYLVNRHNLTTGEAIAMFKYEIMNYPKPADPHEQTPETEEDYLTAFFEKIQTETYKPVKTGIDFFDNFLDGGVLRQTLLVVMAAPGVGKTTLCQQIAETMAENKQPVIYINLEMSREQMLSKAFSARLARQNYTMTPGEILQGYKWTDEQRARMDEVRADYQEKIYPYLKYENTARKIWQIEKYITNQAEKAQAGTPAPIVILDYLHLIDGDAGKQEPQIIKDALAMLKTYAIKYNTFVFAISAVNRDSSKNNDITMFSGRDTSGIEYTADYILAMEENTEEQAKLKEDAPLKAIKIKLEKTRFSSGTGKSDLLYLDGRKSLFTDKFISKVTKRGSF